MAYKWKVLFAILPSMTMFLNDTTMVNIALIKPQAVYNVDVTTTVQWAISGYSLALGVATPLGGLTISKAVDRLFPSLNIQGDSQDCLADRLQDH